MAAWDVQQVAAALYTQPVFLLPQSKSNNKTRCAVAVAAPTLRSRAGCFDVGFRHSSFCSTNSPETKKEKKKQSSG